MADKKGFSLVGDKLYKNGKPFTGTWYTDDREGFLIYKNGVVVPYSGRNKKLYDAEVAKNNAKFLADFEASAAALKETDATDETAQAAAKVTAGEVAAGMPKLDPKTGIFEGMFTGKFGVFEVLQFDPIYGAELREIKAALAAGNQTLADDLWNRSKWGRLDSDAQDRYLTELQNKDLYKERLKSWLSRIKPELARRGLKTDDATLEKYYKDGIDDSTIFDELAGGVSAKGAAGDIASAADKLRSVARANGFNLDRDFSGQIDGWLQRVSRGEDVEDFARIIRQQAKLGLPEKVGALLDEGLDLANIYAPYRNTMAALLEVTPDSIDLDDPLLRSAYGPDKETSIYDFKRAVRKDPRWQYTDNAREEVSNVALTVLRDFGFQG